MAARVRTEVRQRRPSAGTEVEALLNLQRTADAVARRVAVALKPAGLSGPQYNILRILRGAGPGGLACREICERMVTRDPDMTRLLDRLEARRLVTRERGREDRRVVKTHITENGVRLLEALDAPIVDLHRRLLGHMGARRLRTLIDLLEVAREKAR